MAAPFRFKNFVEEHGIDLYLCLAIHHGSAGPKPILVKDLTMENLTRVMAEADSGVIRQRAQTVGQRTRSEDGIGETINGSENILIIFIHSVDGYLTETVI